MQKILLWLKGMRLFAETLSYGVIPAIAFTAHALLNMMLFK
jgi:hypothetical protein